MSPKTKQSGGLGTNAFYKNISNVDGTPAAKKMRTTIMLPPELVAAIETLRTQARKNGTRLTTSQIIEDAIRILLRENKIQL